MRTDPHFAAALGSPSVGLDHSGNVEFVYAPLDNPIARVIELERTGVFTSVRILRRGYGCLGVAPPDHVGPLIEYYHAVLDQYFYAADSSEIAALDADGRDWMGPHGQIVCKPPSRHAANHRTANPPLTEQRAYRFIGEPGIGRAAHYFTIDRAECRAVDRSGQWLYEGSTFRAVVPDALRQCPIASTIPLHRLAKPFGDGGHRLTTDAAVVAKMAAQGWIDEGVTMCVAKSNPKRRNRRTPAPYSILTFAVFDHLRPARGFVADERCICSGVCVRTSAPWSPSLSRVAGICEHLDQVGVHLLHDLARRVRRREHALPRAGLEIRHAALGNRRHVGDRRHAFRARHREDAQLAALHVRIGREHAVEQHVGLARRRRR